MDKEYKLGIFFALGAFFFWGAIAPIYFKQVASVSPFEVLTFRVVASFIILMPLIFIFKQYSKFKNIISNIKILKFLFLSSFFVSLNWLIFIYAIGNDMIIEASLGYYINPLITVFFGYLIFDERMTRNQYIAIFIAFLAIVYQVIALNSFPLISLALAISFALYGVIRKQIDIPSLVGLSIETLLLLPFAIIYLIYLYNTDSLAFLNSSSYITFMLTLSGLVTIIPLLLFNSGATRIKLSTLGILQYLGPSLSFLVAIYIYDEPFDVDKLITFILIWFAIFIFSFDTIRKRKKRLQT